MKIKDFGFILILIPIVIRVVNTALFKTAALSMEQFTIYNIATNYLYLLCFVLFFLRALTWQMALGFYPLSVAYPFLSISYVSILLVGYFVFDEQITLFNMIGSAVIIMGVVTLAANKNKESGG